MQTQSAVELAQAFLDILWADPAPNDQALAIALDRLLAATHDVAEGDVEDVSTPSPESDWQALYKEVREHFPDYGYYAVASPLEAIAEACMTGDVIDDLADITKDLREVLWRGDAFGSDEANWHFRFAYETHWGRHLGSWPFTSTHVSPRLNERPRLGVSGHPRPSCPECEKVVESGR
jgi:hypothetical protein